EEALVAGRAAELGVDAPVIDDVVAVRAAGGGLEVGRRVDVAHAERGQVVGHRGGGLETEAGMQLEAVGRDRRQHLSPPCAAAPASAPRPGARRPPPACAPPPTAPGARCRAGATRTAPTPRRAAGTRPPRGGRSPSGRSSRRGGPDREARGGPAPRRS